MIRGQSSVFSDYTGRERSQSGLRFVCTFQKTKSLVDFWGLLKKVKKVIDKPDVVEYNNKAL